MISQKIHFFAPHILGYLPHKTHKHLIWTWSVIHLKNWQSLINTIKSIKKRKFKIKIKNRPDGPYQWKNLSNLVQTWAYLGKEAIPFLFLLQNQRLANSQIFFSIVISQSRRSEKAADFFSGQLKEKVMELRFHNTSFGRIFFCMFKNTSSTIWF